VVRVQTAAEDVMSTMGVTIPDPDEGGDTDVVTCDYCHLRLDPSESRTTVGTAIFHRHPNCYLRKLYAIRH
jgi:hypothetical protein